MVCKPGGGQSESYHTSSEQYTENSSGDELQVMQTGLEQSSCTGTKKSREECVSVVSRKTERGHNEHCCVQ